MFQTKGLVHPPYFICSSSMVGGKSPIDPWTDASFASISFMKSLTSILPLANFKNDSPISSISEVKNQTLPGSASFGSARAESYLRMSLRASGLWSQKMEYLGSDDWWILIVINGLWWSLYNGNQLRMLNGVWCLLVAVDGCPWLWMVSNGYYMAYVAMGYHILMLLWLVFV